jgi:hypothetical protein
MKDHDLKLLQEAYNEINANNTLLSEGTITDVVDKLAKKFNIPSILAASLLLGAGCDKTSCDSNSIKDAVHDVQSGGEIKVGEEADEETLTSIDFGEQTIIPGRIYKIVDGQAILVPEEDVPGAAGWDFEEQPPEPGKVYYKADDGTIYEIIDPGTWNSIQGIQPRRGVYNRGPGAGYPPGDLGDAMRDAEGPRGEL